MIAENRFEIVKPSTKWSVNNNISKQIIPDMSPSVRKLIGKVTKRSTAHNVALANHNTITTQIAGKSPSTLTHGVKYAAIATAIPDRIKLMMKFIAKEKKIKQHDCSRVS